MFSRACEYGIRSSIYIADRSSQGQKVSLKDVAKAIDSPEAYTSKILQLLARNKIIISEKGPTGGFSMDADNIQNLKISTIVTAIDGNDIFRGCGLGLKGCNSKQPCPIHDEFKAIRTSLRVMLENTTVGSLAQNVEKGISFLKR